LITDGHPDSISSRLAKDTKQMPPNLDYGDVPRLICNQ
jgi:hypothetical protein